MSYYQSGQEVTHTGLVVPGDELGVFDGDGEQLAEMLVLEVHRSSSYAPRRDIPKSMAPLPNHWHTAQIITPRGQQTIPTPTDPKLVVPGGIFIGQDDLARPFGHVTAAHRRASERGEAMVPRELLPSWCNLWQPGWTLRYVGHMAVDASEWSFVR